ncbi:hypothetical protein LXL04_033722 [Taraxacum kok-saghyz]
MPPPSFFTATVCHRCLRAVVDAFFAYWNHLSSLRSTVTPVSSCETSARLVDRLETPSRTQHEPNSRSNKRFRTRTVRTQTRATP